MSLQRLRYLIFPLVILLFFSCSTTNKGVLNREFHTLTTKYNVLFNGKEAFSIGEQILSEAFEDNFYDFLLVEPINLRGENIDQTTIVPGFDRAEEKAVKAIQKHSIKINDIQYNRQIDEAYLLLGKARYFDRRFFPALEAFNFLLESGANRANYIEGKIWREKTNIRLRNVELAIDNLRPLARALIPKNKYYPEANATLADAFMNLKQLDSAVFYIKRAALKESKRKKKARYFYLTGQLFEALNQQDSAQWAYQNIIALKRKAPRKFLIQATIKKNFIDTTLQFENRVSTLQKMLRNFENQPYEHALNHALAKLYLSEEKDSTALLFFDRSLASASLDVFTRIENYQDLADYHFNQGNYLASGSYLDDLLPLLEQNTRTYKKLKRKRDNLAEVIIYEKIVQQTDSILDLIALPEQEQLVYFDRYIQEKQDKEARALQEENERKRFQLLNRGKTAFYFYNPNQVLQGKQNYLAKWGNRPNVDNWRKADVILNLREQSGNGSRKATTSIVQETPESFVAQLPKTKKEKDSILLINQKAYLQLGMIYKEKFNDFSLAHNRLEKVISLSPPDEIMVQALYHLYRMDQQENPQAAILYKKVLINNHPETPFARLLSDPENYDTKGIVTPETLYAKAFALFESQKFLETLDEIELLSVLASGSQMEPKISLLKAHTIGRLSGVIAWKEALTEVATNFSAVDEGIQAKALIAEIDGLENLKNMDRIYKNYKWIFPFQISEKGKAQKFYDSLKKEIALFKTQWSVSLDIYNQDYLFVVVHGIRDQGEIDQWKTQIKEQQSPFTNKENFVTLASQYREYIKNKTWIKKLK